MSAERPKPEDVYGLTEHERLFDRISDERFRTLVQDIETIVHKMEVSANTYGEFLFVTTSRTVDTDRHRITFWGLGFHEYRERWLTQEWFWYVSMSNPEIDEIELTKEEVEALLKERRDEIAPYSNQDSQSERGKLFDMLADLTDDDGIYADMEDLDNLLDMFDE
ncbi:MAG: hypothetical protein R3E39_08210 [Anaerolineae bacterium]